MTILVPTCEQFTNLLTDYEEGALGPLDWLGMKLHLALCPPCQTFLRSFERTPALLRQAWDGAANAPAEHALASALAALREGRQPRGPQHHPEPEAWTALKDSDDLFTALLLRLHLGHCPSCRAAQGDELALTPTATDPLEALRPHLPAEARWRWSRIGDGRIARVLSDARSGATLSLARLQGGGLVPRHDHLGAEVSVLLCGGLQDGPAHLGPGDWIAHGPGYLHAPEADPKGECWALVRLESGLRFEGWRGLFGVVH